jgi:hypothetical protein
LSDSEPHGSDFKLGHYPVSYGGSGSNQNVFVVSEFRLLITDIKINSIRNPQNNPEAAHKTMQNHPEVAVPSMRASIT